MSHSVEILQRAQDDVRRNANWIHRTRSSIAADRWNDGIIAAIKALAISPERYPEADEAAELGVDLRFKMHGRRPHVFRILFTIDRTIVTIHRVRHAAQDRLTEDDL